MLLFHKLRHLARRPMILGAIGALAIAAAPSRATADRMDDFKKLDAEYKAAESAYFAARQNNQDTSPAQNIRNYENWPGWQYLPRFVALAEADPTDDAAYQCCLWIRDRSYNVGNDDQGIFAADQKAWQIIASHHANGDDLPQLCLDATAYPGPAREDFLRALSHNTGLSNEHAGFAKLALAELLVNKCDYLEAVQKESKRSQAEDRKFMDSRRAPESADYLARQSATDLRTESSALFHDVLDHYGDVPCNVEKAHFFPVATLGKRAEQQLYALEHLVVGAEAPEIVGNDLDGKPLELSTYRGRVVVLSFWFTGCGPCMALIPEERKVVEKFHDRPFTLLGICGDSTVERAQKTATDEKINWPCWFDGSTNGTINRQYNVTGWPTLYLIDQNGKIAARNMDRDYLADDIGELLDKAK
jgi:peroxiredoxin